MQKIRNIICIVLSLVLLLQQGLPAQAKETDVNVSEVKNVSAIYINPLYKDIIDISGERAVAEKKSAAYSMERAVQTAAEVKYISNDEEIAEIIREGMVKRDDAITFYHKNTKGYDKNDLANWVEMALEETKKSDEGDYLRWQYETISANISYSSSEESYYFEYILGITYYTTAAQEAEVTKRVESVLEDIGVNDSGITDYEKVKLIYDYICENVSYDTENETDDSYYLKHTAYAALFDKKAVCQGYALLLYRMLEEAGIDSRFVYGTSQGQNHGWNIAKLGTKYYYLDSTWDAGDVEYSYFLRGTDNFANHETKSDFISEYNISAADYDLNKEPVEIKFTAEEVTVTYTGEEVFLDEDLIIITGGNQEYILEYYQDEECTKAIDVPVKVGVYYAKAIIDETAEYNSAETKDPLKVIISPRVVPSFKASNQASGIKLTWNKRSEATGYIIYRKTESTEYKAIKRITKASTTSFVDKDISQGKKYYYNIATYKTASNGEEIKGSKRTNAIQIVYTKITSVANQNGSVKIKWTKVSKAAGYKVYRKVSGYDSYELLRTIKDVATTSYTDKSVSNGKALYYYVVPYYSKSSSVVLKTNTKTHIYITRPTISAVSTSGSKALKVTWKKNSKVTGYQIRYSTDSGMEGAKTVTVTSKDKLSKKISSLKKNKTYYVQVRAYKTYNDVKYYSAWSAKKSKKTK